jgi:zinc finger protein
LPFTFEINDPSGNSFVQNNMAPKADPALTVTYYDRSYNDYANMGYNGEEALAEDEKERKEKAAAAEKELR